VTRSRRSATERIPFGEGCYAAGAVQVWLVVMDQDGPTLLAVRDRATPTLPDPNAAARLGVLLDRGGEPEVLVLLVPTTTGRMRLVSRPLRDDQ